jgi:hypothetical protein
MLVRARSEQRLIARHSFNSRTVFNEFYYRLFRERGWAAMSQNSPPDSAAGNAHRFLSQSLSMQAFDQSAKSEASD